MACSSTPVADLPGGGGGASVREASREMELLKDLPCYDSENFSKFNQGIWKNHQVLGKPYLRLKKVAEDDERGVEILSDQTSMLLRDLEKAALKSSRVMLKRSATTEDTSRKVPRLDYDNDLSPVLGFLS